MHKHTSTCAKKAASEIHNDAENKIKVVWESICWIGNLGCENAKTGKRTTGFVLILAKSESGVCVQRKH